MKYINKKIYGLPKPLHIGVSTRYKHKAQCEYVHKVNVQGYVYFKVHIKRQGVSKIKYFKKMQEAKLFVDFLKENPYI